MALGLVTAAIVTAACDGSSPTGGQATSTPTSGASVAPSSFGPAVVRGRITDERVAESSGLVASRRNPGRLWTHNDSDQPAVLFCVEPDGGPCGGWTVTNAGNVDWEDIAAGPGPQRGEQYLYVGDIGDNTMERPDLVVYRVIEPTVAAASGGGGGGGGDTAPAVALRLRYDDGRHDTESLMVRPTTGDIYVITKEAGDTGVYKARPEGGVLTRIATLGLGLFGLATGADISPDGRRVAICTPFGGHELTAATSDAAFDDIWTRRPSPVTLPVRDQGEAIAYRLDGGALLLTSEGYPSPLFEVPRA